MTNYKLVFAITFATLLSSCGGNKDTSSMTKEEIIEYRVDTLLSQMTFEEKLGQMNQLSFSSIEGLQPAIEAGKVGSILNTEDAKTVNALQHIAVEKSRLHIPLLMSRDVIHGFKTIFPIPLGQGATFDPALVEKGARIAAVEASSTGIRWTFSPMVDIARDARWGRMAEGYGEDPYLTSLMGAATVRGYQTANLSDPTAMAACVKHFVGYGAAESGLDYNSTFIPERQLRNVYLPSFKASVDAGALTVMTSFNDNDGVPSTGNTFILKDILRNEWGFNGFVVTDWGSTSGLIVHGFATDAYDAAMKSINAGVDMEMVSGAILANGAKLIDDKRISIGEIDRAVSNILRVKFSLGLFENPYTDETSPSVMYIPDHLKAAKKSAIESAILLKNDGVLPLKKSVKKVLVVGPLADAPYEQMGTWVFDGEKEHTITPLAALKEMYGDRVKVTYMSVLDYSRDRNTSKISAAVSAARRADVILAFVGEESFLSGEAHCLADLNLVGAQKEMLRALGKTATPLVTVVMAGRPLTIGDELAESAAVLYSFHPGTMGGPALAELLMGDASPSGRTPVTFPRMVGQEPIYYARHQVERPANENEVLLYDIPVGSSQTSTGCRSFYLDAGKDALVPFGFGLTYTTFKYGEVHISSSEVGVTDTLTLSTTLTNTGKVAGTEVVQLYVQDCVGSVTRPMKELKRFRRVTLQPGESQKVSFQLPVSDLAYWTYPMVYKVEPGDFKAWISPNSKVGTPISFVVK